MSKSKLRNVDVIFQLKQQLKEKDEEIRKLYGKIHNKEKAEKKEFKKNKKLPKPEPEVKEGQCPHCKKGKLVKSELGVRSLETCSNCTHRKVTKNG